MSFMNSFKADRVDHSNVGSLSVQPKPQAVSAGSHVSASHSAQSSLLAADVTIKGDVTSKGEVQVQGKVEGDITCAAVMIAEGGQITGSVIGEDVIIGGQVLGTVRGLNVTLLSTAHVEGDIIHKSFGMEQGAFFEGRSSNADDPMAISAQSPTTISGTAPDKSTITDAGLDKQDPDDMNSSNV